MRSYADKLRIAPLCRYGLYASQTLRGLFDRYNSDGTEELSYATFSDGLYGDQKPWPPPPKSDPDVWKTDMENRLRDTPSNNWQTSSAELSPNARPVRVMSLANEKHREQKAGMWVQDEDKWQSWKMRS